MLTRILVPIAGVALVAGCATHGGHSRGANSRLRGEERGLYIAGFEATRFRPCDAHAGLGEAVRLDSAAAEAVNKHLAERREWRNGRWTYSVYYLRWLLRAIPEPPPVPAGYVRISTAPRRAVTRVLKVRAPRPGECGWSPPDSVSPAP